MTYEQRKLGRAVLGPYLRSELTDPPPSLLLVDDNLDPADATALWPVMPRLSRERSELVAAHVQNALDRHFDRTSRRVQQVGELLRQVSSQARGIVVPRPNETLAALATALAGR